MGVLFSSLAWWVSHPIWHFTKKYIRGDEDMLVKHDLAQIFNWLEIPPREVKNMQKKGHPMTNFNILPYLSFLFYTFSLEIKIQMCKINNKCHIFFGNVECYITFYTVKKWNSTGWKWCTLVSWLNKITYRTFESTHHKVR